MIRICSLCPSATETAFALGLGDAVVGVTHACDFPPEVRGRPVLTAPLRFENDTARIDQKVRANVERWGTLYDVDQELLACLGPDVILTQRVCRVCAFPEDALRDVLHRHGTLSACNAVPFRANRVAEFFESVRALGDVAGVAEAASRLVETMAAAMAAVRRITSHGPMVRTFIMEWTNPVKNAGHWIPELMRMAGGEEALGNWDGDTRVCWDDVLAYGPEVVVINPCGFDLAAVRREMPVVERLPGWTELPAVRQRRVWLGNGTVITRYTPRMTQVLRGLAHICHPRRFPEPPPAGLFVRHEVPK
jgi:iron complex transport system substrate-binding protein